jgi:aminoglycoside phosphotransferase (APT) family kinase protein
MMQEDRADVDQLSAIVGAHVAAVEPCRWGFENRTSIVTLEDGRRLVVQRINSRALAANKLHLARVLPERLAAIGLRAPALLAANAEADPPFAVREYLPGETAASLMGTIEGAVEVARAMGALLPRLALVETGGAGLSDSWARPADLARLAQQQLDRCRSLLDAAACDALEEAIAEQQAARFADRPACFAHGDFCPVNVLLTADRRPTIDDRRPTTEDPTAVVRGQPSIVGLLDFEFARIADPLFDAAWWGWVVRYHHPARWIHAWPQLLAAAGILDDQETAARIRVIQRLRCLEMIDYCAATRLPDVAEMWVERLGATLGWQ